MRPRERRGDGAEIGERDGLRAEEALQLHLVHVAIALNAHHDGLSVSNIHERLDEAVGGKSEERGNLFDRLRVGSRDFFIRGAVGVGTRRGATFRLLEVRSVAAAVAKRDAVLSCVGKNVELVRHRIAHVAAVSLHGDGLEAAARVNALIRVIHVPVALVSALGIRVEGVGVLHEKFLGAHEPEPRARLVAELPLDLVDRDGKLAIGADERFRKVGEDFLRSLNMFGPIVSQRPVVRQSSAGWRIGETISSAPARSISSRTISMIFLSERIPSGRYA